MPKFIISWSMSGDVEIEAASRDEAQSKFDEMSYAAIGATCADDGLIPSAPETEEERNEALEYWRGEMRALADRQDNAEEQRHG